MSHLDRIKRFILEEFLPTEDPAGLLPDTALVSSGILDSLALAALAGFLEDELEIAVAPHEIRVANFDTLEKIDAFVAAKLDG